MLASFFSSLLPSAVSPVVNSLENPSFNLNSPQAVALLTQGTQSSAGITVKHDTAISCAAVWQAASMISGDVASMTLNCFKRLPSDDRAIDVDHPAQPLVSVEFNEEMDANEGWRRVVAHALLWGNAYLWIESKDGLPFALYHLLPDRTSPARLDDGTLYYATQIDGRAEPLKASEVLHIKGLALEIDKGADLVSQARDAIGLALAAEGFSSKFYAQGCAAGGVLEIPSTFSEMAASKLEEGFRKRTEGGNNWFKTVILRDGAKFHQLTIDAQKSQTNELRENQVRDIARFFNLPPGKLGVAGSVSYGSYEHSQLEYLSSCLTHWLRAIAFACGMKFLTREERHKTHYFEHNTSNWIEVDTQTMTSVLTAQIAAKIINANEARRKLNMSRRTDPEAESYGNPNTTPGAAPEPEEKPKEPEPVEQPPPTNPPAEASDTAKVIVRNAFNRDAARLAKRLANHAKNLSKNGKKFADWLDANCLDQWGLVSEFLGDVIEDATTVTGGKVSMDAISGKLFGEVKARLAAYLEPPHKASQLTANVEQACGVFEAEIVPILAGIVFTSGSPTVATQQPVDLEPITQAVEVGSAAILDGMKALEAKIMAPRVTITDISRDEKGMAVKTVKTEVVQ